MKRFLSMGSCVVVCLSLLTIVGHDEALTAKSYPTSSADPIKILGVKLNKAESRAKDAAGAKANWLDGLEVAVKNTSGKAIRYLVIKLELPEVVSKGKAVEVPFTFGYAPVPKVKAADFEFFQPGAKLDLKVAKSVCDGIKKQLENGSSVPSANDLQTNIHLVIFEDKTAWAGGQLYYPDPKEPTNWIAGTELGRNTLENHARALSFSKASYGASARPQSCFRSTGFHLQYCCTDYGNGAANPYYIGSFTFASDPAGHVQPKDAVACCQEGDCCSYIDVQGCP